MTQKSPDNRLNIVTCSLK